MLQRRLAPRGSAPARRRTIGDARASRCSSAAGRAICPVLYAVAVYGFTEPSATPISMAASAISVNVLIGGRVISSELRGADGRQLAHEGEEVNSAHPIRRIRELLARRQREWIVRVAGPVVGGCGRLFRKSRRDDRSAGRFDGRNGTARASVGGLAARRRRLQPRNRPVAIRRCTCDGETRRRLQRSGDQQQYHRPSARPWQRRRGAERARRGVVRRRRTTRSARRSTIALHRCDYDGARACEIDVVGVAKRRFVRAGQCHLHTCFRAAMPVAVLAAAKQKRRRDHMARLQEKAAAKNAQASYKIARVEAPRSELQIASSGGTTATATACSTRRRCSRCSTRWRRRRRRTTSTSSSRSCARRGRCATATTRSRSRRWGRRARCGSTARRTSTATAPTSSSRRRRRRTCRAGS